MYYRRWPGILPALSVCALTVCALTVGGVTLAGCRARSTAPERLAFLRFENLSGDSSLDWAGRA